MNVRTFLKAATLVIMASQLSACAGSLFGGGEDKPTIETQPADVLFKDASTALDKNDYTKAAEKFEEVDRQHPYSKEAREAILMSAFAYQKADKLPEAVAAARRYLTLHPGTKEAALAQWIIASSYYDRINDASRDQADTKRALVELETLVNRYPDSRYAEDAKKRIRLSRDVLAAAEMSVGRWYQKKGQHLAAINRFKVVVTEYQNTAHVEEALARLAECYYTLGIVNEAQTAAAVLGHNFPDSKWYKDSYALLASKGVEPREHTDSWLSRQWKKIDPTAKS
ncbi:MULTISPECIES: outer membrane protein assembly factor BamD [Rhodomicrobium]|uniref:outer membrane protein assembly factor BamD n=1 Tax=Rhodomicrobium TaxID=1068 RepID=UPI000B4B2169|nr:MULTISPECIES: outer membrane protein assembly factor BamD [Rhodomicrobium]